MNYILFANELMSEYLIHIWSVTYINEVIMPIFAFYYLLSGKHTKYFISGHGDVQFIIAIQSKPMVGLL